MKILFLVPYPLEGASYRYRIHQFLPYLKKENIVFRISPFISSRFYKIVYKKGCFFRKILFTLLALLRRGYDFLSIPYYDVIFIHVETSPFPSLLLERTAHFFKKPIIYDFDDAIFLERENSKNKIRLLLKSHKKIPKAISLASHVLVCNTYLKDFAKKHLDEKHISVLPTLIDVEKFKNIPQKENPIPVVGWIGSHTTYPYLESILDIFSALAREQSFVLKIIGAPQNISLPHVDIIQKDWSLKNEVEDFLSLDIGVYPLLDTPWARGKAAFKALQYMAAGIPCIASNVGKNKEVIQNGFNGFLIHRKEEWAEKILLLLNSPELRKVVAREGRKTIENHYSVARHAPKFIEIIRRPH